MRTITHRYTGEQITFIHTMEETNGEFLYIEVALPPYGKGPPLHVHDVFEEEFEVVSGTLTITVEKEHKELTEGQQLLAPKGIKHTFNNKHDEPVVFRVKLTPGLFFEESARIHYGLMEDGFTNDKGEPTKLVHTALILSMQNTLVAGLPIGLQRKLFGWLVKRAYKKGAYNNFDKYVGKPIGEVIETIYK